MRKNNFMNKIIKLKGSILAGMNAHLAKPLDIEKVKKTICEQIKIDCIKNNKCL